ncbi:MAG: hypothetical protein ACK5QS_04230 [Pseudanabaenaceae cyanobacterium]|jgi:hypothetical protein
MPNPFNWLASLFGVRWISDSPEIPFAEGKWDEDRDIFTDKATRRLVQLQEFMAPHLVTQWSEAVIPSAQLYNELQAELDKKMQLQQDLAEEAASEQTAIIPTEITYPQPTLESISKPVVNKWEIILSIGLGFMLTLALGEYMNVELQNLKLNKINQVVLLVIAISVSTTITLAIKKSIRDWVISSRCNEPKRRYHSEFTDDNLYAKNVAFWERLKTGDAVCYVSLGVVVLEMLFAAPGLLGMLPPSQRTNVLSQLTAFAAAGLAAYANVLYAWASAFNQLRYDRNSMEKKEKYKQEYAEWNKLIQDTNERQRNDPKYQEIINSNNEHEQKANAAKAKQQFVTQEILELKQRVAQAKLEAANEYERWYLAYKKLLRENPNMVQEFNKLYPLQPYPISVSSSIESLNGHKNSTFPVMSITVKTDD